MVETRPGNITPNIIQSTSPEHHMVFYHNRNMGRRPGRPVVVMLNRWLATCFDDSPTRRERAHNGGPQLVALNAETWVSPIHPLSKQLENALDYFTTRDYLFESEWFGSLPALQMAQCSQ